MFTAKVYNVMVGSLSGIMEEVTVAKGVIREWNQQNAERNGKVFLNVDWTSKGKDVKKIDVVIGIVGNWLEDTELIDACITEGKQVMLFFNSFQDPKNTIASEHDDVKAFRDGMLGRCDCVEFRSTTELKQLLEAGINTI
jgi:hypothetical protein